MIFFQYLNSSLHPRVKKEAIKANMFIPLGQLLSSGCKFSVAIVPARPWPK
jgi:hypothetical protein